jgi:hypothetical protein
LLLYGWLGFTGRVERTREGAEFLDGAEPDPISLAESTIDGASLRHTHLRAANERGSV